MIAKLEDIPKLYAAIKEQADDFLYNTLIKDNPDHVYCGQFLKSENGKLTVKVSLYINTYSYHAVTNENEEPIKDKTTLLNPSTDWFYQSRIWFKKSIYGEHNYESFINYIEPYREPIKVDVEHPIVSFVIEF